MSRHVMIITLISLLTGVISLPTFAQPDFQELEKTLDSVLDSATRDAAGIVQRNAVVRLEYPGHGFVYQKGSGIATADGQSLMTAEHQFYVESITKTFTATMVLQLAEEGKLGPNGLDATLADLEVLPAEVLTELHQIDGVSYGADITVRNLVQHRTGMKNFTYDDEQGTAGDYPDRPFAPRSFLGMMVFDPEQGFISLLQKSASQMPEGTDVIGSILENGFPDGIDRTSFLFFNPPFKHWDYAAWQADRTDRFAGLLNFYLAGMNRTSLFPPGQDFMYTDTNYLVLGLLIEKVTGNSLHTELRRRILNPLEMDDTYMSFAIEPPAGKWKRELAELWALDDWPIVALNINRSMMWSDRSGKPADRQGSWRL